MLPVYAALASLTFLDELSFLVVFKYGPPPPLVLTQTHALYNRR